MDTRSQSNVGYVHHQGDVWAGVGSSHGVGIGLHPTSTGAAVYSVGDDANVSLNVFAKGTGAVTLGNSSNTVTIAGSGLTLGGANSTLVTLGTTGGQVQIAGSTAPFAGFIRLSTDLTTPTIASTDVGSTYTTCTVPGANSSHFVVINSRNLSTAYAIGECGVTSTANELLIKFVKCSTVAGGASTFTANILVYRF